MQNINNIISEKWKECLGCKYNTCKKKNKININDYLEFNCTATIEEFNCGRFPELYPEKLLEKDPGVFYVHNPEIKEEYNKIYIIEIINGIDESLRTIFAISNDPNLLRERIKKSLKNRNFKNNSIFKIKILNEMIKDMNVIILPKNINKIVYPGINVKMNHELKEINMKEMVLNIDRNPNIENNKNNRTNLSMDIENCYYEELIDANNK